MKVAVVVKNNRVSEHLGLANQIDLYDINNQDIKLIQRITTQGHQHGGVPVIISGLDVNLVICGHIGEKAKQIFEEKAIKIITGASGKVEDVLTAFINNTLISNDDVCKGHDHHHEHHDAIKR